MIVTCNECEWRFKINAERVKETGSNVRCSKCGNIWKVNAPAMQEQAASEWAQAGPDFEDGADELPDLEGLLDLEEEPPAGPAVCEADDEPQDLLLEPDESDCIDLSDLDELIASETPAVAIEVGVQKGLEEVVFPEAGEKTGTTELEEQQECVDRPDSPQDPADIFELEEAPVPDAVKENDKEPELILTIEPEPTEDQESLKTVVHRPAPSADSGRSRRRIPALAAALAFLLVVLAAGIFYGARALLSEGFVRRLPLVSEFFSSGSPDGPFDRRIELLEPTLSETFIANGKAGQLLVITGRVRAGSHRFPGDIRVVAKLYAGGAAPVKSATVYCGRILSSTQLATLDMAAIDRRLGSNAALPKRHRPADTGAGVPFMVVFDDLPADIEAYSVEVAEDSQSAMFNRAADGPIKPVGQNASLQADKEGGQNEAG